VGNGKSYTEVVLEFSDRLDVVEQRIIGKLDAVIRDNADFKATQAKNEAECKAVDDKVDGNSEDIKTNAKDIKKVGGLNAFATIVASTIAGIIGTQK
jgi:hypothetical protein